MPPWRLASTADHPRKEAAHGRSSLLGAAGTRRLLVRSEPARVSADKVLICHRAGPETNPFVLIEVSGDAIAEHTAHDDVVPDRAGNCVGCAPHDPVCNDEGDD